MLASVRAAGGLPATLPEKRPKHADMSAGQWLIF